MEDRPNALLLKFPGTNCDEETARALRLVGFVEKTLPIAEVSPESFEGVDLVVLSGGFSYGDYVMAGRFAQLEIQRRLGLTLESFRDAGGYILGICNGFQILMRMGLLPKGTLIDNHSERFVCRWTGLIKKVADSPYLTALPEHFELPIAHAEGRFITKTEDEAANYLQQGSVPLCYAEAVNGSYSAIAALQDQTKRVFGMMPHPERFVDRHQHYDRDWSGDARVGWGYYLFQSVYNAIMAKR